MLGALRLRVGGLMASPVPTSFTPPSADEISPDALVYGRTLVTLAGAAHHVLAWHVRGWCCVDIWQGPEQTTLATDSGMETQTPAAAWLVLVPYFVPVGVDWLHVAVTALALSAEAGGTTPEVTVSIEEQSGTPVDDGVTWTRADGSLPGRVTRDGGTLRLVPFQVETEPRTVADPTPGAPGVPRRLSVAGFAGGALILRIEGTRCRPIALHLLPEPRATL